MKRWLFVLIGAIISLGYVGNAEADKVFLKALQDSLHKLGDPWIAGETEISKLSIEEKQRMCGCLPSLESVGREVPDLETVKRPPLKNPPPAEMDWRDYNGGNWMTSVKYQCDCGACWAFAWVSAQEARMKIWRQNPHWDVDLSEQFVISCNPAGWGCSGGKLELGDWIKLDGIPDHACYPYVDSLRSAGRSPCTGRCGDWQERATKVTDWGTISSSVSASVLKDEIMRGPVGMIVNMKEDFFYYKGGVYEPIMGKSLGFHAICVCGWNSSGAWLCKNSWDGIDPYFLWNTNWQPMKGAWMDPDVSPDTGTPIIWTTNSLNFVFHQGGKSYLNSSSSVSNKTPSSTNLESILLEGEHILEPSLTKADEDTIQYDNESEGIQGIRWPENNGWVYWGVKFTPPHQCNVVAALHAVYTATSREQKLIVRDDAGGTPGEEKETVTYNTEATMGVSWTRQNLATPYNDFNDFWLTYYGQTSNSPLSLIVQDKTGGERSYWSGNGNNWDQMSMHSTASYHADFKIRAVVTYEGGYAGSDTIWVKNTGAGKLTVSDAHSAQGSSWIVDISPKSFNIYSGDSAGIGIGVDTSGLQKDVLHQDEIVITSNSGKTESRVPVTLIVKTGGIAEETAFELATFKLSPNPFRDKVDISYFVPEKANVKLVVHDIAGREVAKIVDRLENTGIKKIDWDTKDVPSGVYFCRLAIGDYETTRKVLLMR